MSGHLGLLALLGALLAAGPAAAQGQARLALVVGIDKYPDPAIHDLSGAVNDAQLWAATLKQRFGFTTGQVRLLLNGQATRQGIQKAFYEHLVAQAGPGTAAVFIYSGHGSRLANPAEADGFDETLVPCDSGREGRKNLDITDDEFNRWVADLAQKTPNITVIRDSCHAGGSVRATARLAPEGKPAAQVRVDAAGPVVSYVALAAARNDQLAHERYFEGRRHGQLTWHLTRALLESEGQAVTWGDLMDRVRARLDVEGSPTRQTPQLEGEASRRERKPFELDLLPPRPGYETVVTADGVRVETGALFGFAEGSELEVLPPAGEAPGERAVVRLVDVGPTVSMGKVIEGGPVRPGSRAFELRRMVKAFQAMVHVPPGARFGPLRTQLGAFPQIRLVDEVVDAELAFVAAGDRSARLRTPDGLSGESYLLATPEAAVEATLWWARWLHLDTLRGPDSGPKMAFRVDGVPGDPRRLRDGTHFNLTLTNRHDGPIFLWVVSLSPDGHVYQLHPIDGTQEALKAGGEISFPVQARVDGDRALSRERIVALATTRYTDFSFLATSRDVATRAVIRDPLQDLLVRTVQTRGVTPIAPLPVVNWNIARWELEVVKE
ncbi:MAG: caspase family protein [Myxococcales bacterium]|nr:caspase family protein [Myxococcales bacterium]MCB9522193.1 caspase family protein [Myxococcales bacterium]